MANVINTNVSSLGRTTQNNTSNNIGALSMNLGLPANSENMTASISLGNGSQAVAKKAIAIGKSAVANFETSSFPVHLSLNKTNIRVSSFRIKGLQISVSYDGNPAPEYLSSLRLTMYRSIGNETVNEVRELAQYNTMDAFQGQKITIPNCDILVTEQDILYIETSSATVPDYDKLIVTVSLVYDFEH